jgi:hypothetical protein
LATLEEISDKEGVVRVKQSVKEYKKKQYITMLSPDKIREAFMKN